MKYYFEARDSENCFLKGHFVDLMKEGGIKEMEVFPARIEYGVDYFWCEIWGEVGEKGDQCGRFCGEYKPRNGKNGRCCHQRHCYTPDEKPIVIKLKSTDK